MTVAWRNLWRTLTFRSTRAELVAFDDKTLLLGIVFTWLVGIGRYWDDPKATLLQHFGVGSVLYVFALALFLWLIVLPYRIPQWSYRRVLTYVTLTAPPALLYAIPVERFLTLDGAIQANTAFLALVALYRVALLGTFFGRMGLRWWETVATVLLPLMLIVASLSALNLEHAVFEIMGGLRREHTPNDGAFAVVNVLTLLSMLGALPCLLVYGGVVYRRRSQGNK